VRVPTANVRPPHHRRHPWISRLSLLAVGALVLLGGTGVGTVAAGPVATVAGTLTTRLAPEPFGEYVTRLSFDVTSIEPALVTAISPNLLTISGTMTNAGPEELTDLAYRFQRGAALPNEAAVRQEIAEPAEPTDRVQQDFTPMIPTLAAGASTPFTFTVPIAGAQGLDVSSPGVYPLMVNVNGAVTLEGGPLEARVGELHLLLTVMGAPGTAPAPGTGASGKPLPVNFVWPVVDRPHLGVGGVFLDDDLQTAIAPGGRLATLVDGLLDPAPGTVPMGAITVVVDPQLLDELDRMTSAYRVVAPGEPQPSMDQMLQAEGSFAATAAPTGGTVPDQAAGTGVDGSVAPNTAGPNTAGPNTAVETAAIDPTTAASGATTLPEASTPPGADAGVTSAAVDPGAVQIPGTVAGTGQGAAASFLERLRTVAARYPTLALPYGDPDVVAMVRAGLLGEVTTAVEHGTTVAERVLGTESDGSSPNDPAAAPAITSPPITSMAFPINGATDAATLTALQSAGLSTALLSEESLELDGSAAAAAVVAVGESDIPAAVAQPDVLSGVGDLIDHGRQSGWAKRVNALTGVLAQQSLDGSVSRTTNPAIFTPDRRWSPDAPGLRVLTDLLATLGASQVISGTSLTGLAASASEVAVPAYPEQAQAQELNHAYLERVKTNRADVTSLQQSLGGTPQTTDPALVLDPLVVALDAAGSTAFRTDAAVGEANLATVESTTAGIRGGVEISSAGNSYTLASSSSPLVLTVQNNLPYNVPLRVEITGGEFVGLTVTNPELQVVPAGRSQQVKIPAEVSRSGQFQVRAVLVGPDGSTWGQPVQLSVESTAYGALTVIIIVVAGGVLVLMVALRIVQRLRGKPDTTPGLPGDRPADDAGTPALRDVIPPPTGPGPDSTGPGGPAPENRTPASEQVGTDRS